MLAVGDVVGHGPAAAAVMAQLRAALRAYAVEDHPPAGVVERVNTLMWQLGPTAMTTLVYLVLDPAEETLELVNAGHPPPLVVAPDGEASYLPLQGTMALGASTMAKYHSETFPLPTGSTVVLYTDGLVERRGESIDDGLERLRVLVEHADDVDRLVSAIIAGLVPDDAAGRHRRDRRAAAAAAGRAGDPVAGRPATRSRASAGSCAGGCAPAAPARRRPTTSRSPARRRARTRSSTRTGRAASRSTSRPAIATGRSA